MRVKIILICTIFFSLLAHYEILISTMDAHRFLQSRRLDFEDENVARLTCRVCVPARSFCYLGGPAAYMGDNFLKEFSVQRTRASFILH